MKKLAILGILYPLMMIFTFGHAAQQTYKETMVDCQISREQNPKFYCSPMEMSYRLEAISLSLIWPYYWSEYFWNKNYNTGAK